MVKVAIAGGTGGLGKHIVDAILATRKHDITVLSRSANPSLEARGVHVVPVSYTDPASLEHALQGIHTVISTISDEAHPDVWVASQLALLDAAKKAGVVRFAPSYFGRRWKPSDGVYTCKTPVVEAVKKSGLEYTMYENGGLMNYLAIGTKGIGYLKPFNFGVDIEHCTATIPGDGNTPFVFTRAEDVGAFVAASLDLPKWPEYSRMSSDVMSWNEVVKLSEEVRGKTFTITRYSIEEIEKRIASNPPDPSLDFYWKALRVFAQPSDPNDVNQQRGNLNDLCPSVKPMGVKEFLQTWWGGLREVGN